MNPLEPLGTPRGEDCPSDFLLLQLDAQTLGTADERRVRAHLAHCERCQRLLDESRAAFAAVYEADGPGIVSRVHGTPRKRRAARWPVGAAAALAAALLLFVALPRTDEPAIRNKGGGLALRVYRERGGVVEPVASGERFQARDRLRFEVDLPADGHVLIVGAEASGALYPCFPSDGTSNYLPRGDGQLLAGAIELDASLGRERIQLVVCPKPFALGDLERGAETTMPAGCQEAGFELDKGGP